MQHVHLSFCHKIYFQIVIQSLEANKLKINQSFEANKLIETNKLKENNFCSSQKSLFIIFYIIAIFAMMLSYRVSQKKSVQN